MRRVRLLASLPPDISQIILLFLATRIVLLIFGWLAAILVPLETRVIPTDPNLEVPWLRIWAQWDVAAYLKIADSLYSTRDESLTAFFPLYGLAIRALSLVISNHFISGLLISNISHLVALVFIYKLTMLHWGDREMGLRAAFYALIYPSAFYAFTAYSEALYLALVVASFYFMHNQRWLWAGLCGGLAAATRHVGLTLVVPFLIEYIAARSRSRFWLDWGVVRVFFIIAGTGSVAALMWLQMGNPLAFLSGQEITGLKGLVMPWDTLRQSFEVVTGQHLVPGFAENYATNLINLASTLLFIILAGFAYRWIGPSYAAFMVLGLLIPLSFTHLGDRPLIASIRYNFPLFPGFMVLARWGRNPVVDRALTFAFLLFYGLLAALFVRSWNIAGVS